MKKGAQPAPKKEEAPVEADEITEFFEYFESNGGKINPKEIKYSMKSIGFDNRTPDVYQIVSALDTPENERNGGVDRKTFVRQTNIERGPKDGDEELRRVFELFLDGDSDVITLDSFKGVAQALGVDQALEKTAALDEIWKRTTKDNVMDFDGFKTLMTKSFIGKYENLDE